ncbi:hypothetical protein K501DRAFT_252501 [Backusella circina FSU 941]|nr:hypothetical protein K501DRAFT_252501 [Backusella circina FSU 941]
MKLMLISTVLLAASTMVSAAPYLNERAPTSCTIVSGVCGKNNGNGVTGACCISDNDCKDTCNNSGCGVSDGTKPQSTCPKGSTTTLTATTTKTTTTATSTSTPSTCKVVAGVCGKKNGNGTTGACCSSDNDCKDTCNSTGCGVSDGTKPQSTCPNGSTTTLTATTTKTTTTATSTSTPSTCKVVAGVCGKKNGNGTTGACCSSDNDCKDTCNSTGCGVSDVAGVCGKKNGNGTTGACCSSDNDCKDTCNSTGCGVSDGTNPQSTCPATQTL